MMPANEIPAIVEKRPTTPEVEANNEPSLSPAAPALSPVSCPWAPAPFAVLVATELTAGAAGRSSTAVAVAPDARAVGLAVAVPVVTRGNEPETPGASVLARDG